MRQNMNFLIKKSKEQYYKATSKVNFHRVNVLMKREKKKRRKEKGIGNHPMTKKQQQ